MRFRGAMILVAVGGLALAGCSNMDPHQRDLATGGTLGAMGGAAIGLLAGGGAASAVAGGLLGGVAGAVGGDLANQ